ncbi:MAG: DinB family protein [Chloroflexi bacterium]|nr:DinB family protein [Chloroflexota bacterium]
MDNVLPLVSLVLESRNEFLRALSGLSEEDCAKKLPGLNTIAWTVGHVARGQDHWFNVMAQGQAPDAWLSENYAANAPTSNPSLKEALAALKRVNERSQGFLRALAPPDLRQVPTTRSGRTFQDEDLEALLQRCLMHHWLHLGEIVAIRSILGREPMNFPGNQATRRQAPSP